MRHQRLVISRWPVKSAGSCQYSPSSGKWSGFHPGRRYELLSLCPPAVVLGSLGAADELPQRCQVERVHILVVRPFLGSFQHHGMIAKARIVQEHSKRLKSQAALADMGVPVDAAAEGFLAVVEVKCAQFLQADDAVKFLEG